MSTGSPIAAALAQLQLERDNLAARLEKVDALIASMREVFHLPRPLVKVNGASAARKRAPTQRSSSRAALSVDAVRKALKAGPMSPGALEDALGAQRGSLRYQLSKFVKDGLLVTSGSTASRRIALADGSAKEAP